MEALANKGFKYQLIKVDVAKWESPVAKQFDLHSLPSFVVYDTKLQELHRGDPARDFVYKLLSK